jgi:hypothetical protein
MPPLLLRSGGGACDCDYGGDGGGGDCGSSTVVT